MATITLERCNGALNASYRSTSTEFQCLKAFYNQHLFQHDNASVYNAVHLAVEQAENHEKKGRTHRTVTDVLYVVLLQTPLRIFHRLCSHLQGWTECINRERVAMDGTEAWGRSIVLCTRMEDGKRPRDCFVEGGRTLQSSSMPVDEGLPDAERPEDPV